MKKMKAPLLFVLFPLLILKANFCSAQDNILPFHRVPPPVGFHFGSKAGVQDSQGYMWIGSYKVPLRRFDGYNYTFYAKDPLNQNSLAGDWVEALCAGRNGLMWIGTYGFGLDQLDPATGNFKHYRYNPKDQNSLSSDSVRSILEDREGVLWIGTPRGLNRLDPKTGIIRRYQHNPNDPHSLSCNPVTNIYEDRQGTIWVATGSVWHGEGGEKKEEGGLNRLDKKTGKFIRYLHSPANPHSLINNKVKAIFEDSRGTFWVGTAGDGLHTMDRASGTFVRHTFDPAHPEKLSRPPQKINRLKLDDHITFIIEDATGVIWIGTFGNGLNRYDPKTEKVTHYPDFKDPETGVQLEIPWWAYTSRDGMLWVGYYRGLYRIDPLRRNIPYYTTGVPVTQIYEDKHNVLWYGSGEGLVRRDRDTGTEQRFVHDPNDPHSISSNKIISIHEDRQGILWICTGKGLNRYDRERGTFLRLVFNHRVDSILSKNEITSIYDEGKGAFLMGTIGGLIRINEQLPSFTLYLHIPEDTASLSHNEVYFIYKDNSGNLWLGTRLSGLNRLIPQTGKFQRFLSNTNIHSLWQDSEGILWVGTSMGLYQSNPTLNSFSRFNGPNGEFTGNMIVNGVLEDDQKNLWLNASIGICRLNSQRNDVVIFNRYEDPVYYEGTGINKGKNGELFFGGSSGYFKFHPEQLTRNTHPPQIVINEFRLSDQPLMPGQGSPLKQPLAQTKEIRLQHHQNAFSFNFAGIHYSQPEQNQHLFRLEGLDNTWRKAGEEKTAYYYNVPPGQYTFRIKASNSNGVWAEKAIAVLITPPWWRTWWAYGLYGLAISGLLFGIIRLRLRQERERQALERERWEAEQLKTVDEMKTRFFSNITHEFRTPLSLILPPTEQLLQEIKEPQHQHRLSLIRRHAGQLLGLINQLLDLIKLEAGHMAPTESRGDLAAFIAQLVDSFRPSAAENGIALVYETQLAEEEYVFDDGKWSKIVYNLLANALKFTPTGGQVTVKLKRPEAAAQTATPEPPDQVLLTVEDTGIGIPADKQEHIFDRFYQVDNSPTRAFAGTGIGLSLVKELVDVLQGQIRVNSLPGAGTSFCVTLPVRKAGKNDSLTLAQVPALPHSFPGGEASGNTLLEKQSYCQPVHNPDAPLLLVIDDNTDLRDFIAAELAGTYRVLTAANGEEGWQLVQQELPEVVISDVMMPLMDGYALTERIKTNLSTNHIAVILLTAKAAQESKVAGLGQGADDYLTKPFHLPELRLRLRNLLDHQEKLRQHYQQHLSSPEATSPVETVQDKFLHTLSQAIEGQLDNSQFDVEALAAAMAMSRRTLYRKLSALTGLSPNDLIRDYRLNRAAQFLKSGHAVSETAYLVGFESPSYFGQCFKEKFKIPPSDYSQRHLARF